MQNLSAGQFLYGSGEEHTIRLLLKSKGNIADIFLNKRKEFWRKLLPWLLKASCMQIDLLSSLHLLLSHICSMVYSKRYILILKFPLVAEKFIVEAISFSQKDRKHVFATMSQRVYYSSPGVDCKILL